MGLSSPRSASPHKPAPSRTPRLSHIASTVRDLSVDQCPAGEKAKSCLLGQPEVTRYTPAAGCMCRGPLCFSPDPGGLFLLLREAGVQEVRSDRDHRTYEPSGDTESL